MPNEQKTVRTKTPAEIAAIRAATVAMLLNPTTAASSAKRMVEGNIQVIPPGAMMVFTDANGAQQTLPLNESNHGQYCVTFSGKLETDQVAKSESGKSLVATVRVDLGRAKLPLSVRHPEKDDWIVREFGSFNMNLTLGTPREASAGPRE